MDISGFLEEWNNSSDSVLVHTSGSTGKPKPMLVLKARMLASAKITCDFLGLEEGNRALLCMPLDFIAGKMMVVRSIERKMELINVEPSSHPLAGLDGQSFDLIAMVPYQVHCSVQVPREREILMNCKNLIIGGGAVSDELQKEVEDFPNAVWSTYGMTETLSHIALRRLNGSGRSEWYTPFENVRIGTDKDGCLWIDAPLIHDGVLQTNDIAELHTDSTTGKSLFKILGRKDNVICSGGIKLQIERIEQVLRPYMKVPFCISRRKDEKFGEIAVLLTEGTQENLTEAVNRLEKYSRPKDIVSVSRIPLTGTGKIDRRAAELLASKH
ncbi:MAG: AMP-binding protein [Bacteroidales bacterium]|nr:AMP-binding protein [Bacteroidales bacterium]